MADKTDGNQTEIVAAYRAVGASVQTLHSVKKGCPDLLVGFKGVNYLIEVKNGSSPPSARKLTPDQVKWHAAWRGAVCVVKDRVEALAAIGLAL